MKSGWTLLVTFVASCSWGEGDPVPREGLRWLKGNTHTHTIWSDGDAPPEQVVEYYDERGYDFLCLSEHNIVADHEKWFAVQDGSRLRPEDLAKLSERFGSEWVEQREVEGGTEMRLKRLDELQERLHLEGSELLLIPSEEVTDAYEGRPVHINGTETASATPLNEITPRSLPMERPTPALSSLT